MKHRKAAGRAGKKDGTIQYRQLLLSRRASCIGSWSCMQAVQADTAKRSKGWIDRHCDTAGSRTVEVVVDSTGIDDDDDDRLLARDSSSLPVVDPTAATVPRHGSWMDLQRAACR